MAYEVTSWFIDQTLLKISSPVRKFTIGSSDYSSKVIRWPTFRRSWNDIRPVSVSLELANEDQELLFFKTDNTKLRGATDIQIGFNHPSSGDELISVFKGTVSRVKYRRGSVTLTLHDKLKEFTERVVGDEETFADFDDQDYLPSEIAWIIATCYGGMANSRYAGNEDIDFQSFETWAEIWSSDSIFMRASFDGLKVNDILKRLGRLTHSAIFIEDDKLGFHRFTFVDSNTSVLDEDSISDLALVIDDTLIVNRQLVLADYDVTSAFHKISVVAANTPSVDSFGSREDIIRDEAIWFTTSVSALNLAQRLVDLGNTPYEQYEIESTLVVLGRQLGETIKINDEFLSVTSADAWRLMEYEINLETGKSKINVDGSQLFLPFTLDDAVLGLLDGDGYLL